MSVLVVKQDVSGYILPTANDVIIVANAPLYEDTAQIVSNMNGEYNNALNLTSSNAYLTVAGNYRSDSYQNTPYNILVTTNSDWRKTFTSGKSSWTRISAVGFDHNGTLYLTSQAGARTAAANKDGAAMLDKNLAVKVDVSTEILQESYTSYPTPSKTLEASAFYAAEKLTLASNLVGSISAANTVDHSYYTMVAGGSMSWFDISSGNKLSSFAVHGGTVTFQSNVTANVSAQSKFNITSEIDSKFDSNTLSAVGILADGDLESTAIFGGTVMADNEAATKVKAKVYGGTLYNGYTVSYTGNMISAAAVEADGQLHLACLGSIDGQTASLTALAENVVAGGTAKKLEGGTATAAAGITVTGNSISVAAVKGGTVTIDKVEEGVSLAASINGVAIDAVSLGSGTLGNTLSVGSNNFSVAGIQGNVVELGDFCGLITATANTASFDWSATGGGTITHVGGTSILTASGIYADSELRSAGSLGGTISVSAQNGSYCVSLHQGVETVSLGRFAGLCASTISVAGRIDSDITVTAAGSVGNYGGLVSGIEVGTLSAEAISGVVSAEYGINAHGALKSSFSNDALDISGTISAEQVGIYTGTGAAANLRVSGVISAKTAIQAELYRSANSLFVYTDTARNDMVEIAAGGTVQGRIDLRYGINRLILDSSATVDGVTKASNGLLNYIFLLNGKAADHAVISTSGGDDSLYSNTTFNVSLDYARNGESYTLFTYDGVSAADVASSWNGRQVTFVYKGAVRVATIGQ